MTASFVLVFTPAPEAADSGNGLAILGMIVSAVAAAAAIWAAMHAQTQANMAQNQAGDAQRSADAAKDQAASAREQVAIGKEQLELAKRDREEADKQWEQDRTDADRRLREERDAADRRLQQQLDEKHDRDRRQFLVEQLQKAAELWSKKEIFELPGVLAAIPDEYATIVRFLVRGEDYNDAAGFPPMSDAMLAALEKQLTRPGRGLVNHGKEQYLVDKIREMKEGFAAQGRSKDWGRMHRAAVELYRVGYDYKKVKQAWLYEEIGENITDILGVAEDGGHGG